MRKYVHHFTKADASCQGVDVDALRDQAYNWHGYEAIEHEVGNTKMEKTHVTISGTGLQIPLKELQQYGVEPGSRVTLEFGQNRILVTLPITDPHKVEDLALRLTLRYLGDAARVKAIIDDSPFNQNGWKVGVYPTDTESPAGYLFFSQTGEFLPELSTRFDLMRA